MNNVSQGRASALLGRLLGRTAEIKAQEVQPVVTAFLLFFCVLGGYFAVRPVRETVGTILGAERVSDLYVVTWLVSIAVVPLYGWACTKFRRSVFLPWIYGVVALADRKFKPSLQRVYFMEWGLM